MRPVSPLPLAKTILFCSSLALCATLSLTTPSAADTGCYSESCSTTCSPDAPVEISTLISSGSFPAGATTPIDLVDPNDGRGNFLIATKQGIILVWEGDAGAFLPAPFIDLSDDNGGPVNDSSNERGLLSLTVDPDYATNGRFYVFYTSADVGPGTTGDIIIARYERSAGNPDVADPGSVQILLAIDHPSSNHNGGDLAFGPDGFLYISTGDGGGGCDGNQGTSGDGQSLDTLAGKMLRIDVRGIDGSGTSPDDCGVQSSTYTVPSDNPFTGQGANSCDEVWALGLRNPFRFSFDRNTGDLFIGDVGQNKWEEINLKAAATPAPVNFGWVCREGCETAANDESECAVGGCPLDIGTSCQFPRAIGGYWDPMVCHHNGSWGSIMGGYRYRGSAVPSIAGDYIYSDAYCGQIWKTSSLDVSDPATITSSCWASGFGGEYGFAEDSLGELYVIVGGAGRIDCIHNGEGCHWVGSGIFADGFESGDTSAW